MTGLRPVLGGAPGDGAEEGVSTDDLIVNCMRVAAPRKAKAQAERWALSTWAFGGGHSHRSSVSTTSSPAPRAPALSAWRQTEEGTIGACNRAEESRQAFVWSCRGSDSNRHGGRPPQDFKSCASTHSATPAGDAVEASRRSRRRGRALSSASRARAHRGDPQHTPIGSGRQEAAPPCARMLSTTGRWRTTPASASLRMPVPLLRQPFCHVCHQP
jgi:hypothetical protein